MIFALCFERIASLISVSPGTFRLLPTGCSLHCAIITILSLTGLRLLPPFLCLSFFTHTANCSFSFFIKLSFQTPSVLNVTLNNYAHSAKIPACGATTPYPPGRLRTWMTLNLLACYVNLMKI